MIHLAGVAIRIGADLPKGNPGWCLQVCSLCGTHLVNTNRMSMPLNPDGSASLWPAWECGAFVEVTTGFPTQSSVFTPEEPYCLPKGMCIDGEEMQTKQATPIGPAIGQIRSVEIEERPSVRADPEEESGRVDSGRVD